MLYGTTKEFLRVFGLASPEDLPPVEGGDVPRRDTAVQPKSDEAEVSPEPTEVSPEPSAESSDP